MASFTNQPPLHCVSLSIFCCSLGRWSGERMARPQPCGCVGSSEDLWPGTWLRLGCLVAGGLGCRQGEEWAPAAWQRPHTVQGHGPKIWVWLRQLSRAENHETKVH
jgi:hypothetical protein